MSKKHFIELANYIKQHNKFETNDRFSQSQIKQLARFCKAQNSACDGFPCGELECVSHESLSPIRIKKTEPPYIFAD